MIAGTTVLPCAYGYGLSSPEASARLRDGGKGRDDTTQMLNRFPVNHIDILQPRQKKLLIPTIVPGRGSSEAC